VEASGTTDEQKRDEMAEATGERADGGHESCEHCCSLLFLPRLPLQKQPCGTESRARVVAQNRGFADAL